MPFLGELSALLTACLWSGGSMAFASAAQRLGSFQVNVTRLLLAAACLVALVLLLHLEIVLSGSQLIYLAISGLIGLSLGDTFLFKAYQENGARVTMLIMSIAPAIAALSAFLLIGESLSRLGVLGIAITLAGVGIVLVERGGGTSLKTAVSMRGIIYAALAAAGQGTGLVFAKLAFREGDVNGFVATMVRILAALLLLVPFAVLTRRYRNPVRIFLQDRRGFYLTLLGAMLGPFLGISFSLIAIEHTKVGIAATIMAIVPILMLPLVKIIYKETLTWRAILGACTAVAGVAVLFLKPGG